MSRATLLASHNVGAQSEENKSSLDDAVRALQKDMHEFHGDRDHAMCNTQNRSIPAAPLDASVNVCNSAVDIKLKGNEKKQKARHGILPRNILHS
jgi:hypothetical protein